MSIGLVVTLPVETVERLQSCETSFESQEDAMVDDEFIPIILEVLRCAVSAAKDLPSRIGPETQSRTLEQQGKQGLKIAPKGGNGEEVAPASQSYRPSNHADLQNYELQFMLLQEQNRERLLKARPKQNPTIRPKEREQANQVRVPCMLFTAGYSGSIGDRR